jgi:hypothetical protein
MGEQYKDEKSIAALKRLIKKMREEDSSLVGAGGSFDPMFDASKKKVKHTSKTTKQERQALRDHIEELDKQLKKKPVKVVIPNPFHIGQTVALDGINGRTKGRVQYIACRLALPPIKECDKRNCNHNVKNYVWVSWTDGSVFSYRFSKLRLMETSELVARVGRELSGKIGPWLFDAVKRLWKKDGDDKLYTEEEFADILYYDQHPYDKEDGDEFLRLLKKERSFH